MLPMNMSDRLYCAVTSANSPPFIIASGVAAVTTSAPPKSGKPCRRPVDPLGHLARSTRRARHGRPARGSGSSCQGRRRASYGEDCEEVADDQHPVGKRVTGQTNASRTPVTAADRSPRLQVAASAACGRATRKTSRKPRSRARRSARKPKTDDAHDERGHSAMITSSMIERVSSLLRIWGLEEAMSFQTLIIIQHLLSSSCFQQFCSLSRGLALAAASLTSVADLERMRQVQASGQMWSTRRTRCSP